MASLVNPYFPKGVSTEQNLWEGIKTEAIKVMGRTYYYLPRAVLHEDLILGEDILSKFSLAIPIEMYMQDNEGFAGDREMFSKFGLEIRNSYKLVVSVSRWETEVKPQVQGTAYALNRPQEGDLIYDPLTQFLMEIKFVDHDTEFFQLGKNYLYHLSCEAFQYSSEDIETGIEEIDLFDNNSLNTFHEDAVLLENGNYLMAENGNYIVKNGEPGPLTEYGVDTDVITVGITHTVKNPFE